MKGFDIFPNNNGKHFDVNDRDLSLCTSRQRAYIYGLLDKAQMSDDDLICDLGFNHYTIKEFTVSEAKQAIDYLKEYLGWV